MARLFFEFLGNIRGDESGNSFLMLFCVEQLFYHKKKKKKAQNIKVKFLLSLPYCLSPQFSGALFNIEHRNQSRFGILRKSRLIRLWKSLIF